MKINIAITGWDENHPSYETMMRGANAIFDACREVMNLSSEAIDTVWLADFEHFDSTVEKLVPGEGYRENGLTFALAKSIPIVGEDGSVSTIVVIQAKILTDWLNTFLGSEQPSTTEMLVPPEYGLYCVYHELGHCKDHFVRADRIKAAFDNDPRFWIVSYAKNQVSYLAAEFAASVHSAVGMSANVFRLENEHFTSIVVNALDELRSIREPSTTQEKREELVSKAPYSFWLILIEYAKLFGSQLGNENIGHMPVDYWLKCNEKSKAILEEFHQILVELWDEYPNWTFDTFSPLVQLWRRLVVRSLCF